MESGGCSVSTHGEISAGHNLSLAHTITLQHIPLTYLSRMVRPAAFLPKFIPHCPWHFLYFLPEPHGLDIYSRPCYTDIRKCNPKEVFMKTWVCGCLVVISLIFSVNRVNADCKDMQVGIPQGPPIPDPPATPPPNPLPPPPNLLSPPKMPRCIFFCPSTKK